MSESCRNWSQLTGLKWLALLSQLHGIKMFWHKKNAMNLHPMMLVYSCWFFLPKKKERKTSSKAFNNPPKKKLTSSTNRHSPKISPPIRHLTGYRLWSWCWSGFAWFLPGGLGFSEFTPMGFVTLLAPDPNLHVSGVPAVTSFSVV